MQTIDENIQTTRQPSESALRRKAARRGYKPTKIRPDSRRHAQYGPFMIVNASTNGAILWGMSLQETSERLAKAE